MYKPFKNLLSGYNKGYDIGISEGYQIGYEVAKDEYTAYYDTSIKVLDDFKNYREKLGSDLDLDYLKQTEEFLNLISDFRHEMPPYLIIDPSLVRNILRLEKLEPSNYKFIHFVRSMLEDLIHDSSKNVIGVQKTYCKLGILLLKEDSELTHYKNYAKFFDNCKSRIMKLEWERI